MVVLFLIAFSLPFINNQLTGKSVLEVGMYNYTNSDNKTFSFEKGFVGENERHILYYDKSIWISKSLKSKEIIKIPFRYSPFDLENIHMDNVKDDILNAEVIYVTRDYKLDELTEQKDGVAMLTLTRVLDDSTSPDIYKIPTSMAITGPVEGVDSPVIGCAQSSVERRVIELRQGDENRIYKEGECIVMEFVTADDSIKVATKLTYHILGIM
nr:hypothetical protein [Nanoarchaeum sp.]